MPQERYGLRTRPFCVALDRLPAILRSRIAARYGLDAAGTNLEGGGPEEGSLEGGWLDVLLLGEVDNESLREALIQPCGAFVEVMDDDDDGAVPDDTLWAAASAHGFFLSLTTGTAIGLSPAVLVCDALAARAVLAPACRANVELCLHEAIANSLVHGNLAIASALKNGPDGYNVFSALMNARLKDPQARRRRIEIFARWNEHSLEVGTADQGQGFDVTALPTDAGHQARSGRGFVFMRTLATRVTVCDDGRTTVLRFPR